MKHYFKASLLVMSVALGSMVAVGQEQKQEHRIPVWMG